MTPRTALARLERRLLAACAVVFIALGSLSLARPGLSPESNDPGYGLRLAQGLRSRYTDWSVPVGRAVLPLRVFHPYDFCAFDVYWSALAIKAFGAGSAVLRLSSLALGALTLLAFYFLCRLWLGRAAALSGAVLLAVNPAFLLWGRLSYWAVEAQLALPATASLALVSYWHRRRKPWALYAGAFLWGLTTCISTKALAFLIAYPLLYVALVPRKRWPEPRHAAIAAACAVLGAADFLAYNAAHGLATFRYLYDALWGTTTGGVQNLSFESNLAVRASELLQALTGESPGATAGPGGARDLLLPAAFAASYAGLAWGCDRGRAIRGRPFVLLLLSLLPLLLAQTCFTPHALDRQHLLVLWPFTIAVVAAGLDCARRRVDARWPGWGRRAAAGAVAALALSGLRVDADYFSRLAKTGGAGAWSSTVDQLAEYLDDVDECRPLVADTNLGDTLPLLTDGRVQATNAWPPVGARWYKRWAARPGWLLVTSRADAPSHTHTSTFDELRVEARAHGMAVVEVKRFMDEGPEPRFVVWRLAPRHARSQSLAAAAELSGRRRLTR